MHSALAVRTDFSLGESILTTKALPELASEKGITVMAMTDTMSITGMIDFTVRCGKEDIKPIIGVRLTMTDDPFWRPDKEKKEKKKDMPQTYSVTLFALSENGMKAIFRLLTLGNAEPRFYYVPKLGWQDLYEELEELGTDDIAMHLGDERSALAHPDIENLADNLQQRCPNLFVPLVPVDTPYYGRMNEIACDLIELQGLDPIVIRPALYSEGDADSQEVMNGMVTRATIDDPWFRSRHNRDMHLMDLKEMVDKMGTSMRHLNDRGLSGYADKFTKGLRNTDKLVDMVKYKWEKAEVSLPIMAPDEYIAVATECQKGFKERFSEEVFGHKPTQQELKNEYLPRLKYELSVLKRLNFSGYFLLVQDIVRHAKENDILVGPGRGSVGGSLVAYLMGITDCDPIRFDLMFERFINPDRLDLPDADLDFMSTRRHEVIEYLVNKYGKKRVAGVSNFGTLASASAIRNVGRTTGIPEREYAISKLVPKKHGNPLPLKDCATDVPEIEAFAAKFPGIWPIMETLEGKIRNFASHAAGIVVSGCDIVERAVIEERKDSSVVCWDKRIVEDQGFVKVDILGLSTLDIIGESLNYIQERHGKKIDINRIPLDDEEVLRNFAEGRTTGIFQFESGGMRHLLKELGYNGMVDFEDITAATALYRPGPMESGMMDSFYKRKQGEEVIEYDHPLMEPVLEKTFGVIVYQEQVMKISQVIAGYNGAEADKLRKIMGKKLPEEMAKERGKFVDGCVATIACQKDWAGRLFDKIEGFAGYGFNRSHSIEYTLISYQAMWLKINYPVEFYAASLTLMDQDKLTGLIRDAKQYGINVGMPNINHSTNRFEIVSDDELVIPFQRIKGISDKTGHAILEARGACPFTSKADFTARVNKRSCNTRAQGFLDDIGAFASVEPSSLSATDPARIKHQIDLLPGLISANVPIGHVMENAPVDREAIDMLVQEYRGDLKTNGMPIKPFFGKKADFMIIADGPNNPEDINGVMGSSQNTYCVDQAIDAANLEMKQVYWTSLIKRPKEGTQLTMDEIDMWKEYLYREIEILKPPVIVLLGSTTTRHFLPDFKGKASDQAGMIVYNKAFDTNLVVAFSPGEIYHAPEKQENMNAAFAAVKDLLI